MEEAPWHAGQHLVLAMAVWILGQLSDNRHHFGEQFGGWAE
jgi:hypothetical protein